MFFVWLELVAIPGTGGLTVVVAGYTILTLALMAQFGRDPWRAYGETFSVWFRTLNRLSARGIAPAADPEADPDAIDATSIVRRPFASGLLEATWETPRIVLVAVATGSIIFDGGSQTVRLRDGVRGPRRSCPRRCFSSRSSASSPGPRWSWRGPSATGRSALACSRSRPATSSPTT